MDLGGAMGTATIQNRIKIILAFLAVIGFYFALCWLYFSPAFSEVFSSGKTVGLGSDESTLPYYYDLIPRIASTQPSLLLNGALYSPQIGAPGGAKLWIPMVERSIALFGAPFFTATQMSLIFLIGVFCLGATLAYLIGRVLGFSPGLALSLGVICQFTPATLVRSQIHLGLAAVYPILAMVLGALLFIQRPGLRSAFFWGLLLVLAATGAHYIILVVATLFPVAVGYLFIRFPKNRFHLLIPIAALGVSLISIKIPYLQSVNHLRAVPEEYQEALAKDANRAWDLEVYSARVVDYFTGTPAYPGYDLNPLRRWLTKKVADEGEFYPQERSSGIRWWIFMLLGFGIFYRKKIFVDDRPRLLAWIAVAAFLISLSPRAVAPLGRGIMPSLWVQWLIPEMRAPNRWAVGVSVASAALGLWVLSYLLARIKNPMRRRAIEVGVILVSVISFLPTKNFAVSEPAPSLDQVRPTSECGLGVILPYRANDDWRTYRIIAGLRGTDCRVLNAQQFPKNDRAILDVLSEEKLGETGRAGQFLKCMGVQWIGAESGKREETRALCSTVGAAAGFSWNESAGYCEQMRTGKLAGLQKKVTECR